MIWMQNLIEMKKNAIVMVLEALIMSQTFSLDLNSFFLDRINYNHRTKGLKLVRLRFIEELDHLLLPLLPQRFGFLNDFPHSPLNPVVQTGEKLFPGLA